MHATRSTVYIVSAVQCSEGNEGIAGTGVAAAGARARRAAVGRAATAL